ncbi:MAG: GGDEF domain-containing protein, partial [Lachnospiraceae bacterium]|nr:GGDEF domain-containing protein [Lachnospiraceae bacterium]
EGYELLHPEEKDAPKDEISAISKKIRSLQKYMGVEIAFVRAQAYKDMLTGLENRTAYTEYIEKLENKVKNKVADFTVAMFDINGLKQINDIEGHDAGDVAINKAADILRESFPDERIFRIGGDEFVVILNKTGAEIERLIDGFIKRYDDLGAADKKRPIMSVGYAEHDPKTDNFYCDTFERADKRMYENKKAYYEKFGNRRNS